MISQIIKFFGAGAISTLCDWVLYASLVLMGTNHIAALAMSFGVGASINFSLNRVFTFKIYDRINIRFMTFVMLAVVSFGISAILLHGLVLIGVNKILSRIVVTILMFLFNFNIHRKITFRAGVSA